MNFEVEAVVDKKYIDDAPYFLIKWKDYPSSQNTWEPMSHLTNIQELIHEFELKREEAIYKYQESLYKKRPRPNGDENINSNEYPINKK